jgi:hypothetical protein
VIEEKMNFARALVLCFTKAGTAVLELLRLPGRTGIRTRFANMPQYGVRLARAANSFLLACL